MGSQWICLPDRCPYKSEITLFQDICFDIVICRLFHSFQKEWWGIHKSLRFRICSIFVPYFWDFLCSLDEFYGVRCFPLGQWNARMRWAFFSLLSVKHPPSSLTVSSASSLPFANDTKMIKMIIYVYRVIEVIFTCIAAIDFLLAEADFKKFWYLVRYRWYKYL